VGYCILSTSFNLHITEKGFITKFCPYGDHIKKVGLVELKTSGERDCVVDISIDEKLLMRGLHSLPKSQDFPIEKKYAKKIHASRKR
jgi:hypothetical protein